MKWSTGAYFGRFQGAEKIVIFDRENRLAKQALFLFNRQGQITCF
jgi:hypothetical protein